jgi:hypothetical protein
MTRDEFARFNADESERRGRIVAGSAFSSMSDAERAASFFR